MKLGPIIIRLRLANTYFKNKIGGAAQIDLATKWTVLSDTAFVVPLSEEADSNTQEAGVNQIVKEKFAVVCALKNDESDKDKTGIAANDTLHDIRSQLVKELVGLDLGYESPIYYAGGRLLAIDDAYMWYQFEFEYTCKVVTDTGGFGFIQSYNVSERKNPEELDEFQKIFNQYVFNPDIKWEQIEEIMRGEGSHLPLSSLFPNAEQWVDFSDAYRGGFSGAFNPCFDVYRRK